jgi:hypothetical protein
LFLDVLAQASVQECPQDGDGVLLNGDYFAVSHRDFELVDGSLVLRRIYLFIPFAAEDAASNIEQEKPEPAALF